MSLRSRARHSGRPVNHRKYQRQFLRHVHHLIGQGFQAIVGPGLRHQDEPTITGMLAASIESFLDDPRAPEWVERYSLQDERHLNDSERQGKSRLRVDFELTSSRYRPRPRFQIEAKRLRNPKGPSLNAYLGKEGLGCFLEGRYAAGHPWAGMMGYVQSEKPKFWFHRIRSALSERSKEFSVSPTTEPLYREVFDPLVPDAYRSDHLRLNSRPIEIHHIFLDMR